MKELSKNDVELVCGANIASSQIRTEVRSSMDNRSEGGNSCTPGTSSSTNMPYFNFACTLR